MKLSILILTHNRPKLFKRAITSVLNNLPQYKIEIIVNNDSHDIEEVYDDRINIKYYYETSNDISYLYKFLFSAAEGQYVYFLEDDDYIRSMFFNELDFSYDINYFDYVSEPLVQEIGPLHALKRLKVNHHLVNEHNYDDFVRAIDDRDFQLSQILFKKSILDVGIFPTGNCIHNDKILFNRLNKLGTTIKYITKQLWVQTTDGQDNISFDNLNHDERFR
jgi:glycosyltransferase involved in cell wall biosynthesis